MGQPARLEMPPADIRPKNLNAEARRTGGAKGEGIFPNLRASALKAIYPVRTASTNLSGSSGVTTSGVPPVHRITTALDSRVTK